MSNYLGSAVAVENKFMVKDRLLSFHEVDVANAKMVRFMHRIANDELIFKYTRRNFAVLYDAIYAQHLLARFTIYKGQGEVGKVFRLRADVFWRDTGSQAARHYLKYYLDVNNHYLTSDGIGNFTYWPTDIIRRHSAAYEDYNMLYNDPRFQQIRRDISYGILTTTTQSEHIAWGTKGYIL